MRGTVGRYVIEGDVHSHETKEFADGEEVPGDGVEDFGVEEGTAGGREEFGTHDEVGDEEGREHDEGKDPGCPAESYLGLEFVEDDRIDHAA